ncbi:uncharacterized protein LOC135848236 [Planococcus citri]|uniref:uncharacterized protein LOC135848236 n=1 Tax=Planococcus citri TaxID=170843 RepID=UPI0031F9CA8C
MEVEQHQELEMAQVASKVYDIIHPTPVSLKQLSAITISLELWRRKLNEYRTTRKLEEFDTCRLRKETAWMNTLLPDLPSTIYKTIEDVVSRFGYSIGCWGSQHFSAGFCFRYDVGNKNYVLEDFDDFVCDYDGSIDYAKTAERMMRCERFNSEMKFIIACLYCFEDDIRRIWPSVSRNMNVYFTDFDKWPQLYYWICRLSNNLDKIKTFRTLNDQMLMSYTSLFYNRSWVEYFWNRIPLEYRIYSTVTYLDSYHFVRFILPKLDDEQLDKYVNDGYGARDGYWLYIMFMDLNCDEWVVLRTWHRIRNIIKESIFTNLIVHMLEIQDTVDDEHEQETWKYLCCQIWNHSPATLKSSVIRVISSDNSWLENFDQIKNPELLLTILRDASLEEKNLFLRNCWSELFQQVGRKYVQKVIELCFEDEDEINQFKQNLLINSRDVLQFCVALLKDSCFEVLNAFVRFCCTELQAARNLKQRILRSAFLDGDCKLSPDHIRRIEDLKEFVNDAFDNVDEFKNLLVFSSSFMWRLWYLIFYERVSSETIVKFITTLFSTEETVMQVKNSLIDSFKERLANNVYLLSDSELNPILLWCLGSNEAVEEFKLNCSSL